MVPRLQTFTSGASIPVLGFLCFTPFLQADDPITSVILESEKPIERGVITFACPFHRGDAGDAFHFRHGGEIVPAQIEVKRRHPDGSIKHAVVSLAGRDINTVSHRAGKTGRSVELEIHPGEGKVPEAEPVEILPPDFSARVTFRFPDGSECLADACEFYGKALAGERTYRKETWLDGPLTREIRLAGPPRSKGGAIDPDLLVLFGLRAHGGGNSIRVEVVVELPWLDAPGNIPYHVTIQLGKRTVFQQEKVGYWKHRMPYWIKGEDRNLGHFAHSRWRKVFWCGEAPGEVHVRHRPSYLTSSGLLPPYDSKLVLSSRQVESTVKRWEESPREILENGIILAYFPTTGGREEIGPYPTWAVRYLLGGAPIWNTVLVMGDLAGSFPVHHRDRETGRTFSIDDHPGFSLNRRGTFEKIEPRQAEDRPYLRPLTSPYSVDCAHQPSLAFIPYLLTGEPYYLEEMYFWANWCMLQQNAAYRQKEKGLIAPDQTRGEAWALRQLVDAAKIAPDGHPEKAYFESKVETNLEWYQEFISGPDATPLGTYTLGASDAYVRGRSPEERRRWLTLAPWQQNFLVWSLDHAARAGYPAAQVRDYLSKMQIGLLDHPEEYDPAYAAPYFLVVGMREEEKIRHFTTWKELFQKTFRVVAPDVQPGLPGLDYGSSYAYIARAVLLISLHNDLPRAREALEALEKRLPRLENILAEDPTWAFGGE